MSNFLSESQKVFITVTKKRFIPPFFYHIFIGGVKSPDDESKGFIRCRRRNCIPAENSKNSGLLAKIRSSKKVPIWKTNQDAGFVPCGVMKCCIQARFSRITSSGRSRTSPLTFISNHKNSVVCIQNSEEPNPSLLPSPRGQAARFRYLNETASQYFP